jgi:hypothetical protein|tara:strand:- start:203 stop:424 length:222 start_codon:yes stop_codon:yes gene_type:complete
MAMKSVSAVAEELEMSVNDVRRIARSNGYTRYKDSKIELYNMDDFSSFSNQTLKPRKLSTAHKAKLNKGRKKN